MAFTVSSSSSELPRSPKSWRICPDLPGFSRSLPGHLISQKNRKSRRWISKRSENVPPWLSRNYQKQRCAPTWHAQPFPHTHDEIAVPLPCAKWNLHYDTQIRKNMQSNWHAARFGPWSFRGPKCCTWQFSCHPAIPASGPSFRHSCWAFTLELHVPNSEHQSSTLASAWGTRSEGSRHGSWSRLRQKQNSRMLGVATLLQIWAVDGGHMFLPISLIRPCDHIIIQQKQLYI